MRISVVIPTILLAVAMHPASGFPSDTHSQCSIFGIDIEDLQRAVAEHRNSPKRKAPDDPATVEFTFEPGPLIVMAYTTDCIFDFDWIVFNPGTTATLALPAGTYEFFSMWRPDPEEGPHSKIVILESLALSAGTHRFDIHKTDAEHVLEVHPYDPTGSPITVDSAKVLTSLRRAGCDLPVSRSEGSFDGYNVPNSKVAGVFSTLSDAYSFETHFVVFAGEYEGYYRNFPAYSYSASFRDGIDDDVIVTTDPALWHEVTVRHHPEPWREHLLLTDKVANHPFANLPGDQLGQVESASCHGGPNDLFPPPFEQQYFVYPNNDPEATVGFFSMSARDGPGCWDFGKVLYRLPLIGWDDGIKGFLRGSSEPVYVPNSNSKVFHTGLGPYFWFARLDYEDNKITITPSMGLDLLPFLGQTGTRPDSGWPSSYLQYELHRGDILVESNFLSYVEGDGELVIPIEQPGEHTLVATFEPYWMDDIHGRSVATVRLAVDVDDPNPPYLTHFAVKADDEPVAHLLSPGGTVEFTAFDNGSGIANVTAWHKPVIGPQELTVVDEGEGTYRIDLTGNLEGYRFVGQETELTIQITDGAGNFLELALLIPVVSDTDPIQRWLYE